MNKTSKFMEREYLRKMLEMIEHQESSSILGGMEDEYEELENLGYLNIHRNDVQHYAVLTDLGRRKLEELQHA